MIASGEFSRKWHFVTDLDRISRVGIHDSMVLDEYARNTIGRSWNDERVIEANLQRTGFDVGVPIDIAATQAKVPLAHYAGLISGSLKHARDCKLIAADDQAGITGENGCSRLTPGVLTGHQRIPRGRAGSGRRVSIGETQSSGCDRIDIGRSNSRCAITTEI